MLIEVVLPKLGESITEATILELSKKVGDFVEEGDTLFEIATDKVDSEVTAPANGKLLEIRVHPNQVVKMGEILATLETLKSSLPKVSNQNTPPTPNKTKTTKKPSPIDRQRTTDTVFLSPLVLKIAQKENLSLDEVERIPGSGHNGRIQKSDIYKYLKNKKYSLPRKKLHEESGVFDSFQPPRVVADPGDEVIELNRIRRSIASHMIYSKRNAPHVTTFASADMTAVWNGRESCKDDFLNKYGFKLTLTPAFIEVISKVLPTFPEMNSCLQDGKLILKKDINVGVATALPDGNLIVPVIKAAQSKSLSHIAKELKTLVQNARNQNLKPENIQGGTFTLSNVGSFGSLMGTPIINQPQVAVLATGLIEKQPVVVETHNSDIITIQRRMMLSLSFDHRVIDGLKAGTFLQEIVKQLENYTYPDL